jgi:hypothetical protein
MQKEGRGKIKRKYKAKKGQINVRITKLKAKRVCEE